MSVYEIALTDPTDTARPPDRVLRVTAVDQMVFVAICKHDEGNPKTTQTVTEEIAVSLPALRQALELLTEDGTREEMRERDTHGLKARIGGTRTAVVSL